MRKSGGRATMKGMKRIALVVAICAASLSACSVAPVYLERSAGSIQGGAMIAIEDYGIVDCGNWVIMRIELPDTWTCE